MRRKIEDGLTSTSLWDEPKGGVSFCKGKLDTHLKCSRTATVESYTAFSEKKYRSCIHGGWQIFFFQELTPPRGLPLT